VEYFNYLSNGATALNTTTSLMTAQFETSQFIDTCEHPRGSFTLVAGNVGFENFKEIWKFNG